MKKTIYFIFLLFACKASPQEKIEVITSEQLKSLQKEGVEVIDIRTVKEFNGGHIPNVTNIDFMNDEFVRLISEKDKNAPIIIHCASGGRSKRASGKLVELGFTKIYDYSGGFSDWKKRGEEIEK